MLEGVVFSDFGRPNYFRGSEALALMVVRSMSDYLFASMKESLSFMFYVLWCLSEGICLARQIVACKINVAT